MPAEVMDTNYGPLRVCRCLVAVVATGAAYLIWNEWWVFLAFPWLIGACLRLFDLRIVGLAQVNRSWFMNRWTWVFDFALRGYFRAGKHEPLVH